MVLHEAGITPTVSGSLEAMKVIKREKFSNEAAVEFILWEGQQQAEFLQAFENQSVTMRHEVYAAIMKFKNGHSFSEEVVFLLKTMDFESRALDIAMGYIAYTGHATELVPELQKMYPEPLQQKLLTEAFQAVHDDSGCSKSTKSVLHRVIRGLRGDHGSQHAEAEARPIQSNCP